MFYATKWFSVKLKTIASVIFMAGFLYPLMSYAEVPTVNSLFANSSPAHVELRVREPAGVDRQQWPVSSGIGLYKGQVDHINRLGLKNTSGQNIAAQFDVLSCWGTEVSTDAKTCKNSGSIRVVRVSFQVDLTAFQEKIFFLDESAQSANGNLATDSPQNITINTGTTQFVINKQRFNLFERITHNNGQTEMVGQTGGIYIVDENGETYESTDVVPEKIVIEDNGALRTSVYIKGYLKRRGGSEIYGEETVHSAFFKRKPFFETSTSNIPAEDGYTTETCNPRQQVPPTSDPVPAYKEPFPGFPYCFPKYDAGSSSLWRLVPIEVRMEFYKDKNFVKLTTALTNEGGARGHTNGTAGSAQDVNGQPTINYVLYLNEFGLRLPLNMQNQQLKFQTHYQSGTLAKADKLEKIQIHQVNSHKEQDNFFYRLFKNDSSILEQGERTTGLINIEDSQSGVLVDMMDFWQKYPSAISYN